jgi:hypothetical protein
MTTYTDPFTGQTINPSQVGYEALSISQDTYLQWPVNGNTTSVVANIIDVTATASGKKLYLPSAQQVSVGQSVLIRNVGSNSFTVVDLGGNTIVSIASGIADFIYLTNNSTDNGSWTVVTFGAGTSSANAATLAGYGLMAINTTLNQTVPVTLVYSSYTILPSSQAALLVWSGGAGTLTLPSASAVGSSWFVTIKNDGTGILNLALQGTDTIDGNSSFQLQLGESLVVCSNGSTFFSFGYGRSAQFFYTQLVQPVTGGTVTLTAAQSANIIQEYTGTLTSNCTIVLQSTVQLYSIANQTSGSYTLTFKTSAIGASTVVVPQNQTMIIICDGTNVYNAQSAVASAITTISLAAGSATNPSLNFTSSTTTGLYLPASNQIGFAVGGANAATLSSSGFLIPVGISGGGF